MKSYLLRIALSLLVLSHVTGCTKDISKSVHSNDLKAISLTINVPNASNADTRAILAAEETYIEQIDIIVFKEDGVTEKYLYHTHAASINNNGGSSLKKFTASLQKSAGGTEKHRLVIFANLRDEVDAVKSSFAATMTKQEVLALVQFDCATKWNSTSSSDFRPLPMWGQTDATNIITDGVNAASLGIIQMTRAVARLDVVLNIDQNGTPQGFGSLFKITNINLYNTNKKGNAVPLKADTDLGKPTVPAGQRNTSSLNYPLAEGGGLGLVREIYIAESANKTISATEELTCIVMGGYYTKAGDPLNTTTRSWYRIDFYDRTSTDPFNLSKLDILRNHRYLVNIISVDGPGYDTPGEAFNSIPVQTGSEVIDWDLMGDGVTDIVLDGARFISVARKNVLLFRPANSESTVGIVTDDYSLASDFTLSFEGSNNGTVAGITDGIVNSRFRAVKLKNGAGKLIGIKFTALGNFSSTDSQNTQTLVVKCGRIVYKIYIRQVDQMPSDWDEGGNYDEVLD